MKVYVEMDCDIDYAARDFDAPPNDRDYVSRIFLTKEVAKARGLKKKEIDKLIEIEVLE